MATIAASKTIEHKYIIDDPDSNAKPIITFAHNPYEMFQLANGYIDINNDGICCYIVYDNYDVNYVERYELTLDENFETQIANLGLNSKKEKLFLDIWKDIIKLVKSVDTLIQNKV